MKITILLICLALLAAFRLHLNPTPQKQKPRIAIKCAPDLDGLAETSTVPLLPGWGSYHMTISHKKDSAWLYFQQGINLYYGFHIIEALASFKKSTDLDSSFSMGWWGQALAYGPNINDNGYSASPKALAAAQKAQSLSNNDAPEEKALIAAVQTRYTADTTVSRQKLDQAYVDAMFTAHQAFSKDPDIASLYVDAMMQQHPWDLYDLTGKPKAWTPPIVHTLEEVLKSTPAHPGAEHYYIHAVEASDHPEKALAVSARLPNQMPGVSHIVHMPAHIYIRTGNYAEGWRLNDSAVRGYKDYLSRYPDVQQNTPLYLIHNLHMQATCAAMEARYADGMRIANDARMSFDTSYMSAPGFDGVFMQYVYMTPLLTRVRMGDWDGVLDETSLDKAYVYADVLTRYARGIAYARKGKIIEAQNELNALYSDTAAAALHAPAPNYANPGINGTRVAEGILAGVIAESQGDLKRSISILQQAVLIEDNMIYNEPKDWQQPARQFLGNVLLKAGQYQEAERIFREDLYANAKNGWSYTGLATALLRQGRTRESAAAQALAKKAFANSDRKITTAVLQ